MHFWNASRGCVAVCLAGELKGSMAGSPATAREQVQKSATRHAIKIPAPGVCIYRCLAVFIMHETYMFLYVVL